MNDTQNGFRAQAHALWRLTRSDKPVGTLLLLWPTLWALWLSTDGAPNTRIFWVFILGVMLTRAAGCIINDIADRRFDAHVTRTRTRPLVTGAVSVKTAGGLAVILLALAFALVCLLDVYTTLMSFVALGLMVLYPFSKRFFYGPQLILGAAFAWAIPMVYMATLHRVPFVAWLLYAITVIWAVIYDTWYAMADREEDKQLGIQSTALLFASYDTRILAGLQVLMLAGLCVVGRLHPLHLHYYLGILIAAGLMVGQHWTARSRQPAQYFQAFLNNQWVGCAVFIGIALNFVLVGPFNV